MRNTLDMTALGRSAIGFERMLDLLRAGQDIDTSETYPPYNIEKLDDDHYRIALAVAGFGEKDLSIGVEQNQLTIIGNREHSGETESRSFLYQGISGRPFRRQFNLADYVVVKGARLDHGLLTIDLERELPEAMKPRRIAIRTDGEPASLHDRRAA
jgi:molecular chaperone IbpA